MHVQTIRCVADALAGRTDPSHAINRFLDDLVLDPEDTERPPAIVGVLDSTRDNPVARGENAAEWPLLLVTSDSGTKLDPEVATAVRDGAVPITIRVVTKDPETARAARDTYYTLHALTAWARWFTNNAQTSVRTRGQILVLCALGMNAGIVAQGERFKDGAVSGALVLLLKVRDTAP